MINFTDGSIFREKENNNDNNNHNNHNNFFKKLIKQLYYFTQSVKIHILKSKLRTRKQEQIDD